MRGKWRGTCGGSEPGNTCLWPLAVHIWLVIGGRCNSVAHREARAVKAAKAARAAAWEGREGTAASVVARDCTVALAVGAAAEEVVAITLEVKVEVEVVAVVAAAVADGPRSGLPLARWTHSGPPMLLLARR